METYLIKPMLCIQAPSLEMVYSEDAWAAEGKFDGWRAVVHRDSAGKVCLFSGRNSANYAGHLPYLDEALAEILPPDTIIDGELLSSRGRSAVQSAMFTQGNHVPSPALPALTLVVFDVLRWKGTDIRHTPWTQRRGQLEQIDVGSGDVIQHSLLLPPENALQIALSAGLEGIVLKRKASYYLNARSSNWVKIKPQETIEARVVGFKPGKAGGQFDGMVGAFEVELLDTGVRTTVKCGTKARHEDATEHPDRWLGAILELKHHGIQPSGVPLHPQYLQRREDREVAVGQSNGQAAQQTTRKRRAPMAPKTGSWMRNYGQMGTDKLERCIAELERRDGDAYDRVLAHDADADEHIAAAKAALEGRKGCLMMGGSRADHLQWCKDRAMEYIRMGDAQQALASFQSDMGKHPETAPVAQELGLLGMAELLSPEPVRRVEKYIQGFN